MSGARDFAARLARGPLLMLDGGMGSMLIARGLRSGEAPESWNLNRREDVAAIHTEYVAAGSEAVHTNTFGGNAVRLRRAGLDGRVREIAIAAVAAARASGAPFVIGDVGPSGEQLPPVGRAEPEDLRQAFAEQAAALREAGVDALHAETQSDLREARLALAALLASGDGIPVMVSLTVERRRRGFFTIMGDPLVPSLAALAADGAAAVGVNCTVASGDLRDLAELARAAVDAPLVFQPNAGQPELVDGAVRYAQDPETFATDVTAIAALGAAAVGGCCGTDPRFIAALRRRLALVAVSP